MSSLTHVVGSVSEHPRIRSSLLEGAGIEISIGRVTAHHPKYRKNTSTIKIRKLPPPSPNDKNQTH